MESVLIVAGKGSNVVEELVLSRYRARSDTAASCSQARRMLLEGSYDVVIISAPLPDENGVDLALQVAAEREMGVMLLVRHEHADEISFKVEEFGVFVVDKPIHKPFFFRGLSLVYAGVCRLRGVESEKKKLQGKIEEIRLVNRAKFALIQYLGLSEAQAHRYIEKQAMDMRLSKRKVAENILGTYEA